MMKSKILALSMVFCALMLTNCTKKVNLTAYCAKSTSVASLQASLVNGDVSTLKTDYANTLAAVNNLKTSAPSAVKGDLTNVYNALNSAKPTIDAASPSTPGGRAGILASALGPKAAELTTAQTRIQTYNTKHCSATAARTTTTKY